MADAAEVQDVVEDIKELADDTVELVGEKVSWVTQNAKAAALTAGLAGIALGLSVGALLASKKLKDRYQKMADEQIADVKSHYSVEKIIPQEKPPLADLAAAAEARDAQETIIADNGYRSYSQITPAVEAPSTGSVLVEAPSPVPVVVEPISQNIFAQAETDSDDFDWEAENAYREEHPDRPFIITKQEFEQNDTEHTQLEFTYFAGDNVVADEKEASVPIETVGKDNLSRFGYGSEDPSIVYIRNDRLGLEIEVSYSSGKYAQEVLGLGRDELQHSDQRIPRRRPHLRDD